MTDDSPRHDPADLDELLRSGAGEWELDPAESGVDFTGRILGGAVAVRGSFDIAEGRGRLHPDRSVTGRMSIKADSLNTKNRRRDADLRSARFFDVANNGLITMELTGAAQVGVETLACGGELEVAGRRQPIEFDARIEDITADGLTLHAVLELDRTRFGMTWSPLGLISRTVRVVAAARFRRV